MNSTKTRILKSAKKVLIREGSNGFSMRKVASEASAALSNVQYHYKTRDDLLNGLLAVYLEDFKEIISSCSTGSTIGKDGLKNLIKTILCEEAQRDEIKFSLAITSFAEQSEVNDYLNEFYEEFHTLVVNFLASAVQKPTNSTNVIKGAAVLIPFLNGYGLVSQSIGFGQDEMAQELTEIVWEIMNRSD